MHDKLVKQRQPKGDFQHKLLSIDLHTKAYKVNIMNIV